MTWHCYISLIWCFSVVRSQYEPYGENVAYRKHANQSTTYSPYNASLGVDGRISTKLSDGTCSHTDEGPTYSWWIVDLDGFYFIKFIRIYQWTERSVNRLAGSQMYAKEMDNTWKQITFNSGWPPSEFNVSVEINKPVGEIMLNNSLVQGEAAYICVCELQAFKVIECVPFSIENGSIEIVKYGDLNQTFTFGTKFNVTCHEGYRMLDDGVLTHVTESVLECNATGNWSRNLTCSVTVCGSPPNIPNNSKEILTPGIAGNNTYNATMTVECNEGYNYSLNEKEPLRCASDGLWTGNLGNCNVIDCGQPLNIPGNSTIEFSTGLAGITSYNATFTIHCNNGFHYTLPGNETVRCGHEGHWTGYVGTCEVTHCTEIVPPEYGVIVVEAGTGGRWSFNTTVVIICNTGYSLNGEMLIKCLETGRWTNALGYCLALPEKNADEEECKTSVLGWIITGPFCLILLVTNIATCLRFLRHKNSEIQTLNNKSNELENNAMEPYDNLQMEEIEKSEYDQLAFKRESSLKTTMKNEI